MQSDLDPQAGPSRANVGSMFDRIAPRYDLLNRVLSMGLDVGWRRAVRHRLPTADALAILDVATGTGDLLIELAQARNASRLVGIDISDQMLAVGQEKLSAARLDGRASLMHGDAQALEQFAGEFDVVTIAFGIRNVLDFDLGLRQMATALKPGGRLFILEFAEPEGPVFAPVYRLYRRHLLPRVGGWVSGEASAYRYLDETIASFPSGHAFLDRLQAAGFDDVEALPLTMGTVMLYSATKPNPGHEV